MIAINDADTKHLFDNRYGTGQSTMDGILRCTNMLIAGSTVVIAGYGWCGRGVATRAKGLGATVLVTEIDPVRALEAAMDGFQVVSMAEAAPRGDLFITLTGNKSVLRREHFLGDEGRRDRREQRPLQRRDRHSRRSSGSSSGKRTVREFVDEYRLKTGRRVYLLGEGRLINLAAAEGHPAMVMDMSFANQALCVEYLKKKAKTLKKDVYVVPDGDRPRGRAAQAQDAWTSTIDTLTPEQENYLRTWSEGT